MNILFKTLSIVFIFSLTACGEKNIETNETEKPVVNTSIYHQEIVKTNSGDFTGFKIGASLAETKKVLDKQYLVEEESDFLMYKIFEKYTISEYSLIFDGNALSEIALDTKIYDDVDNYDPEAAQILFKDLKKDFLKKFGTKYLEETDETNSILFWTKEGKEIQLIKDNEEVHVYIDVIHE